MPARSGFASAFFRRRTEFFEALLASLDFRDFGDFLPGRDFIKVQS
jgi:hypothetical protein